MADAALGEKDTQVLGISANAKPAQAAFSTSLGGIPYPILSDFYPHGEVAQAYGVFNADMGTPLRAVVVIDKAGVIRFKRVYANAGDLQTDDILAEVDKL